MYLGVCVFIVVLVCLLQENVLSRRDTLSVFFTPASLRPKTKSRHSLINDTCGKSHV